MKNILTTTGLNFNAGQKLSSSDLNKMNSKINELVNVMNSYLCSEINVNVENGELDREYELEDVLSQVPRGRRTPGIKIRFKEAIGAVSDPEVWSEYVYVGNNVGDFEWYSLDNWKKSLRKIIDGGEW